jgi:HD-like signal output (HDOD) protein
MVDFSELFSAKKPGASQNAVTPQPEHVAVSAVPDLAAQEAPDAELTPGADALEHLLNRMRHKSDFPALSDSVFRIQSMSTSETESVGSVTNEILKDVALTNKLLRVVNSAHYARGDSISTVSRAVTLVGFNGIRNMALSLVLLEHMQDKAHASVLKDEFLRSLMAGTLAAELCPMARDSEEAFIGSLFQNLGRMLAEFYFPQEAQQIRKLAADDKYPMSEAGASASVLGLNFEGLGLGVAKAWGLPEGIQRCMRKPLGSPPARPPIDSAERLHWIALAANDVADLLLHTEPEEFDNRLAQVSRHYAKTLGLSGPEIQVATTVARKKLIDLAGAMEIRVHADSAAFKLLLAPQETESTQQSGPQNAPDALDPLALHASPNTQVEPANGHSAQENKSIEILTAGIQDITNAMVEDGKLSDVLRMILETMYRAMACQRIVFCMRDSKTEVLTGRFGLGEGVDGVVKSFNVNLKSGTPDLFAAVCLKGADTMIHDATEAHMLARLPSWYRQAVNAPTFLLLPLIIKAKPFGLIYADKAQKDALALNERELSLLRTLRNQAIMAFKQSG